MNTITVGQQHYRWRVDAFSWLKACECTVYNLVDPAAQLSITLPTTDSQVCTPRQIAAWIDTALRQGWYRDRKRYHVVKRYEQPYLLVVPSSLAEEKALVEQLLPHYNHLPKTTGLEKSKLAYACKNLEKKLGIELPTALQQLYLELGNGQFGPDYGFFLLEEDSKSTKITLLEAYETVQQTNIADWDWQLSKQVLPFMYWGADIYSVIDTTTIDYPVYVLDLNLKKTHTTWQACYWQHCASFFEWLQKWAKEPQSGRSLWLEMYQLRGLL